MKAGYAARSWPEVTWGVLASQVAGAGSLYMSTPRPYREADDDELVSWSAAGDRRAFDEIVTRHGPFAWRVASRIVPDRLAAEDIVQEAMVRAWHQAGHFDPARARFRTWLYRILVNLCVDQRRRVQLEPVTEGFDAADPSPGAEEVLAASERDVALAAALRELPARQRAAMALVYDEGLSGTEAARVLGVSAKALERLLARARATLRERIQAEHSREDL
ncbi:MAG: sigma-70 family RNA polymerase sigma factor [Acetobacteraceae bacterium]|nr:sigma-70 family RNA polymerase sigma factor [Acetobacteraceae bacterium]